MSFQIQIGIISSALYIIIISSIFIGVTSYKKYQLNKYRNTNYFLGFDDIENGLLGKKYV